MRISDMIRIDPLIFQDGTGVTTSNKLLIEGAGGGGDFSVLCQFSHSTCNDAAATAASCSAINAIEFSVCESTANTAAGTVITGATMTLGAATAAICRGVAAALVQVTSNLTTASVLTINGISYQTTRTGVATTGEGIAGALASAINGNATSPKLPHYTAVANGLATGIVIVSPDDDLGTGLTIETTAASSTFVVFPWVMQGMINVAAAKLSTNSPKYIGIVAGESTVSGVRAASIIRIPTGAPAFPGRVINVTT